MSDDKLRDLAAKAPEALRRHIAYRVRRWTHPDELEASDEPTAEDDAVLAKLVGEVPGLLDRLDALEAENARLRAQHAEDDMGYQMVRRQIAECEAENARLRRVLAAERGEVEPPWVYERGSFLRAGPRGDFHALVWRTIHGWHWHKRETVRLAVVAEGSADTALEAMGTADAALEGEQ